MIVEEMEGGGRVEADAKTLRKSLTACLHDPQGSAVL